LLKTTTHARNHFNFVAPERWSRKSTFCSTDDFDPGKNGEASAAEKSNIPHQTNLFQSVRPLAIRNSHDYSQKPTLTPGWGNVP
jgi:hypothetical protein